MNGFTLFIWLLSLGLAGAAHAGDSVSHLFISHPDDPSKKIEFFVKKPEGKGPWPAIIFLHGHQEGSRPGGDDFVKWGVLDKFAQHGYVAVAISQPGYGKSDGPADFCGPFSQHAVLGVIAMLRSEGDVIPNKIILEGISRGAVVAGMVAAQDASLRAAILISGVYDFPDYIAAIDPKPNAGENRKEIIDALQNESGGSPEALRSRSALYSAKDIKASLLIISGQKDDRTFPQQAQRLADAVAANGGTAHAIIYPEYGHKIPVEVRDKEMDSFLEKLLHQ